MQGYTGTSRQLTCPEKSRAIRGCCFASTVWLCPTVVALQFTPKLLGSITLLPVKRLMWKARSNQVVEGVRPLSIPPSEPVLALCSVEFSAEVRELESDPSSAASAVSGPLHFMDIRRSRSTAGRKS